MSATAIRTWLFWTYSDSSLARIQTHLSHCWPGHMGVGFDLDDNSEVYYEALMAQGWTGPHQYRDLVDWGCEPGHIFARVPLPLDAFTSENKRQICEINLGKLSYYKWQLVLMALHERWGIPVPISWGRIVCSEEAARILSPEWELRDSWHERFDEVTPASAWWRNLELLARVSCFNAPDQK